MYISLISKFCFGKRVESIQYEEDDSDKCSCRWRLLERNQDSAQLLWHSIGQKERKGWAVGGKKAFDVEPTMFVEHNSIGRGD